jgi:hypothetical protein
MCSINLPNAQKKKRNPSKGEGQNMNILIDSTESFFMKNKGPRMNVNKKGNNSKPPTTPNEKMKSRSRGRNQSNNKSGGKNMGVTPLGSIPGPTLFNSTSRSFISNLGSEANKPQMNQKSK